MQNVKKKFWRKKQQICGKKCKNFGVIKNWFKMQKNLVAAGEQLSAHVI